jgi:hypothetical protein
MFGFNLGPIVWVVGFLGFAALAWVGIDKIGDIREAHVRAELEPQITRARTERDAWKGKVDQLLDDSKRLDDDNKERLKSALAAKLAAEAQERARPDPAPAAGGVCVSPGA